MNELPLSITEQINNVLQSLLYFAPETALVILFLLVIITGLLFKNDADWMCRLLCLLGLVFVFQRDAQQLYVIVSGPKFLFGNMLLLHHISVLFKLIFAVLTFIIIVYIPLDQPLKVHPKGLSDLYAIIIAVVFGLHLMAMSVNLLMIYLSIEIVSVGSYLMVAYRAENRFAIESGLKYVLFGFAASAVMLYGMSLLYAETGQLNLFNGQFLEQLIRLNSIPVSLGILLVLAGIGFKLSFVPMHFWVPDVYEGASTPVVAFLSTLTKIAGFALLTNFLTPFVFNNKFQAFDFRLYFSVIGILTMIVGNFAAIRQTNIKRMLAYSAIGHTGFGLMALVTFSQQGVSALLFYLAVYALANITALMLCSFYAGKNSMLTVENLRGLGKTYPFASVCFVIVLISLTGLPVSAGFNAKVLVFSSVIEIYHQNHNVWMLALLVIGAVTTVVSLFYYFKIPLYLFLKSAENQPEKPTGHAQIPLLIIIGLLSAIVFLLGIFPSALANFLQ
ncbi:NADH-quinone oxidoreductase subunit N [Mucilaginibacter sp.]|uniref:NADH-quinone oxidoreductase subunit N n=1 Tax=Mucilaginibacter sp. TaxID=1882438 RepID=UPI003AFF7FE6